MSTAIEKQQQKPMTPVDRQMLGLMAEFDKRGSRLADLLPPGLSVSRFKEGIRFAIAQNPDLLQCSPGSIMVACMKAAKLGVDVSGGALGHGYLVPYAGECTFVQGFKGLVALAVTSGLVKDMTPVIVYEKDEFIPEEGDRPRIIHRPFVQRALTESAGAIIAAYTRVTLQDGTQVVKGMMSLADINRVESTVKAKKSPWFGPHRPEMIKKSSVKNAFKTLGIPEGERTERLRRALEADAEAELVDIQTDQQSPATSSSVIGSLKSRAQAMLSAPQPTERLTTREGASLPISHPDAEPPEPGSEG